MRVRSIEALPLNVGFSQTFSFGTVDRKKSSNVLVRINTDEGVVGWGEACPVSAFSRETQQTVVALIERPVRDILVGQNPLHPLPIVKQLEPVLVGCPFTLAAVDMALWDITGKALDVPVSTLLGGAFSRGFSFAWFNRHRLP